MRSAAYSRQVSRVEKQIAKSDIAAFKTYSGLGLSIDPSFRAA
jgi:hypothetical protein